MRSEKLTTGRVTCFKGLEVTIETSLDFVAFLFFTSTPPSELFLKLNTVLFKASISSC